MATIRLIPSTYTRSSSSRVTVTNDSNMYNNTDHTSSYCSIRGRNSSSNTYYCFIHGFNFDDVPNDAIVSSFRVLIRCYKNSYQSTSSSYYMRLASQASSSYVISGTTATTAISESVSVIEIPTGNLDWDDIVDYGSGFSIDIPLRSTASQYPYVYVYGAEIEVTYTLPVHYDITTSTSTGTISPSGTTSVTEGDDFTLTIEANSPTVLDNNVDVTSQIQRITGGSETFIPYEHSSTGFTLSNIDNAYTDISDSTYADCSLSGRTTGTLYLNLGPVDLPSSATITNITCQASLQISRNGSSSSMTASCQMYSGNTAKGSSTTLVSSATDVARTTYTLNIGSWSVSELENARFYLTMYNGASNTVRHVYIYGVSFTIAYTVSGEVYTYTITNVRADHTIVVSAGSGEKIYVKLNGSWTQFSKVYKKVNGSWVEQTSSTWSSLFDENTNYRKMN